MKYFGINRVKEPLGTIPSSAWSLNNESKLQKGEMRIALDLIKLENSNFDQICSAAGYEESKIKKLILDTINKRGKLHNPYTESGGVFCGKIEEISESFADDSFKVGDEVVSLTSMAGVPIHIESIEAIDYNYGIIWCTGYAITFEATKLAPKAKDIDARQLLYTVDEEGSIKDVKDILDEHNPKKVGIIGSRILEMLIYSGMVRQCGNDALEIICIFDSNSTADIKNTDLSIIFDGLADRIYFADMAAPLEALQQIKNDGLNEGVDVIINLEDVRGAETISALLIKKKGFLFHSGVKKNVVQSILATDCVGKEVIIYSLDGYAAGVYDYAVDLVKRIAGRFRLVEKTLSRSKRKIKTDETSVKTREPKFIEDFIYMSPVTAALVENTLNVAKYDCNVIIQGETGVGKEKILNLLHQNSPRKGKPCIKINCATIQENLAESEFFGYEKGAFTGAHAGGKEGYFEMANNGTLFLDEIGTLPLSMQSKLLRVLQENSYYRVGGTQQKHVNVRVICANNIPLKKLVDEGKFREDLYYRLNICLLEVPPLRRRKEDILCLSESFMKNYSKKYGIEKRFSEEALEKLQEYHWPGNVRELENTVHRLYISENREVISDEAVDSLLDDNVYNDVVVDLKKEFKTEEKIDMNKILEEQEKLIIEYALKKEKTTRKAADFLGIPQATLARKKVKYNL